jgi:hypothetical protein
MPGVPRNDPNIVILLIEIGLEAVAGWKKDYEEIAVSQFAENVDWPQPYLALRSCVFHAHPDRSVVFRRPNVVKTMIALKTIQILDRPSAVRQQAGSFYFAQCAYQIGVVAPRHSDSLLQLRPTIQPDVQSTSQGPLRIGGQISASGALAACGPAVVNGDGQ